MIYLASYRGRSRGVSRVVGMVIRWVTRSEWSHCEVCIGNPFETAVMCVSASGMDGGVRGRVMPLNPERWVLVPLPGVTAGDVEAFLLAHQGAAYDWFGVARFALPLMLRHPDPDRWFCSEAAGAIIGFDEPWRFSPADLHVAARRLSGR
jgi:hypothetical protein